MIRSIILCALFLGVANAARQINVDPSPPPPGPTTASVPGALVSLVAPGQSQATWSTAHSAALCASLVKNYTSLYNKDFIECSVKGVVDTTAHAAASVQTWMYWAQFAGMTDADKTSATQSRDLFINTLYSNPNAIDVLGKTVNVNDSCNAAWVSTTAQQSDVYSSIANLPLVQCRAAIRGSTAETYASGLCAGKAMDESLCFKSTTVLGDTTGAFGIDNGKQCPLGAGAITPAVAFTPGLIFTVIGGGAATVTAVGSVITLSYTGGGTSGPILSQPGHLLGGQSFVQLSAVNVAGITGGTGCTAVQVQTYLQSVPLLVSEFTGGASTGASFAIQFDAAKIGCTTNPTFTTATLATATWAARWSPYCDTTESFYQAFGYGLAASGVPAVCPRCGGVAAGTNSRFTYSAAGNNAGKACRLGTYSSSIGVVGVPSTVQAAGFAGTSCISVGVANLGPSSVDNAKPMLIPATPTALYSAVPYPYAATQYAFPSASTSCANNALNCAPSGNFGTTSVVEYKSGTDSNSNTYYQNMALDTEFGKPCSTPPLRSPIANLIESAGIAGNYYLQAGPTGPGSPRGSGTCNTQSLFWNGGTGTATGANGVNSFSSTMLDLPSQFLAAIETPKPAPSPVTPKPAPTPAPTPTGPTPPGPSPLVCTYRGTYEIKPLYAPCSSYYIASGTKSNCAENFVHLRTKSNLGGKFDRIRWALAATAQNGLGTATRVVAEARAGVGACTNRNLAAPSDPVKGLKVGGSSWMWQFRPYPDSAECDHVNMISENRLDTTAFLSVPKPCKTFRYNESDGGRQRFRLIKVSA